MKAFIDTNVLLDLICHREGFEENAVAIFKLCIKGQIQLFVSTLTMINANFTAHRYGYPWGEIRKVLKEISAYVEIVAIDSMAFMKAVNSDMADLEDAVQYFSALEAGVDCIITRDLKGFEHSLIKVFSPNDFLNVI